MKDCYGIIPASGRLIPQSTIEVVGERFWPQEIVSSDSGLVVRFYKPEGINFHKDLITVDLRTETVPVVGTTHM